MPSSVSAIVPTLGQSPWLDECLGALRQAGGGDLEIIVVDQTADGLAEGRLCADRILRPAARPLGFAAANNLAFAVARGDFVALVNDDAIVAGDWLERLLTALGNDDALGAVQGCNLQMTDAARIDGRGIAWNRWWQAVQIDRGLTVDDLTSSSEVFGVSATAAVFRRAALESVLDPGGFGAPFEARLESYYEDVDLAVRLRSRGWRAWSITAARARHAGSTTGSRLPLGALPLIHANRLSVLARLFGHAFWPRAPWILMRDLTDLWQARRHGDTIAAAAIVRGMRRALGNLRHFARIGSALVPMAELRRFSVTETR